MKLPRLLNTTACSLSAFAATVTFAHEGHGEHGGALSSVVHWFTEWDHLAVIGVVAIVALFLIRRVDKAKPEAQERSRTPL